MLFGGRRDEWHVLFCDVDEEKRSGKQRGAMG